MEHSAEKDAGLLEPQMYTVKEVPTCHGLQDTPRFARKFATGVKPAATVPTSTPGNTTAALTASEPGAGSARWPRPIPPEAFTESCLPSGCSCGCHHPTYGIHYSHLVPCCDQPITRVTPPEVGD